MGVGVLDLALGEELARPGEVLDDRDVGRAFLAVGIDDRLATEERQIGAEGAVSAP